MTQRRVTLVGLVLLVAGVIAVGVGVATKAEGQGPFRSDVSDFTPETVRAFQDFPLYSPGTQFEDLPLTAIVRVFRKPLVRARAGFGVPDNRTNFVDFIYGSCDAGGREGGCAPPLTVQIWPACDRTLHDYFYNTPDGGPSRRHERVTVRGVPAARFSDMLEIYSGTVTIVIFGDTPALRARAAASLTSANTLAGDISVRDPLPPPAAGAMDGKLKCAS
jgi:hypothetical protein